MLKIKQHTFAENLLVFLPRSCNLIGKDMENWPTPHGHWKHSCNDQNHGTVSAMNGFQFFLSHMRRLTHKKAKTLFKAQSVHSSTKKGTRYPCHLCMLWGSENVNIMRLSVCSESSYYGKSPRKLRVVVLHTKQELLRQWSQAQRLFPQLPPRPASETEPTVHAH